MNITDNNVTTWALEGKEGTNRASDRNNVDLSTWAAETDNGTTWATDNNVQTPWISDNNVTTWALESDNIATTWASTNVSAWAMSGNNVTSTWAFDGNNVTMATNDITTWAIANVANPPTAIGLKLQDMPQIKAAYFIDMWIEAVILFGGALGNCLLFAVFNCSRSYNSVSIYLYLKVLAVVDFCSLSITLATHWVNYNFLPGNKNLYLCKTVLFTATECLDYGACIIAAMSVDRLIAITMPLKQGSQVLGRGGLNHSFGLV